MARVGSGAWAAAHFGPRGQTSRMARADLGGMAKVMVDKRMVPAFEAMGAIMRRHNYRIRQNVTGGYANRNTASGTLSAHAIGTAVDVNWDRNPFTSRLITDMPRPMVAEILAMRTNSGQPVLEWGGNWARKKDAMHYDAITTPSHLATGLNPNTTRGYVGGASPAPYMPGPIGGIPVPTPGQSTAGQGAKPREYAPLETAPPPNASLTLTKDGKLNLGMHSPSGLLSLTVLSAELSRSMDEPTTLTVRYADPDGQARQLPVWREAVTIMVDGKPYTLQRLDVTGAVLTAVFIDRPVWVLTQHVWTETNRMTQTGGSGTRAAFIEGIIRRVIPGTPVDIQPGQMARVDLAAEPGDNAWETLKAVCEDVKWRCFSVHGRIVIGADEWIARRTDPIRVHTGTPGIHQVEWSLVFGLDVSELTITADTARWSATPSQAVTVVGQGVADGLWLVESSSRNLLSPRTQIRLTRPERALVEPMPEVIAPTPQTGGTGGLAGAGGWSPIPIPKPGAPQPPAGAGGPEGSPGGQWRFPVVGHRHVTSKFGPRGGRLHAGVDLRAPMGTTIVAAKPGTVIQAGWAGGYGNAVYIDHGGGLITRYGHLSRVSVQRGQRVQGGQQVGKAGSTGNSTGPHLHFEIRPGNRPVNPWPYIKNAK